MLKGIDPLINPELLMVLAAMGHGDEIVIADANFPAVSVGTKTVHGRVLRVDCSAPRALQAILSLIPIDTFGVDPVMSMQVVGDPDAVPEAVAEAAGILAPENVTIAALERFDFYDRSARSYAIVHTAETRIYANFIVRKGVILP